jgi:hypothetical protein
VQSQCAAARSATGAAREQHGRQRFRYRRWVSCAVRLMPRMARSLAPSFAVSADARNAHADRQSNSGSQTDGPNDRRFLGLVSMTPEFHVYAYAAPSLRDACVTFRVPHRQQRFVWSLARLHVSCCP